MDWANQPQTEAAANFQELRVEASGHYLGVIDDFLEAEVGHWSQKGHLEVG